MIFKLTMGSLHFPVLAQSFWTQVRAPCPSKIPPPQSVKRSMCSKRTHPSSLNVVGSLGALNVPKTLTFTEALHGPANLTGPNL